MSALMLVTPHVYYVRDGGAQVVVLPSFYLSVPPREPRDQPSLRFDAAARLGSSVVFAARRLGWGGRACLDLVIDDEQGTKKTARSTHPLLPGMAMLHARRPRAFTQREQLAQAPDVLKMLGIGAKL